MFSPNEAGFAPQNDMAARRALRLLFEGNATEETAAQARAVLLSLTGFYATEPTQRHPEAALEARRIMASIIEYTRLSIPELDAVELPEEGSPLGE